MSHFSWPEIDGFHSVRRTLVHYPHLLGGRNTVTYRGKVKLHGTNAGIYFRAGRFTAQSRTAVITPTSDNMGFAKWVDERTDALAEAYKRMDSDMVIFGEWCGANVQRGVALSQLKERIFAAFAAYKISARGEPTDALVTSPEELAGLVGGIPGAYVLPWYGDTFDVPWLDPAEELEPIVARINDVVADVETVDPWVRDTFGVEGTGEGLVYYPISHGGRENFTNMSFKAKGKKHKTVEGAPAQVKPSKAEGAEAFATLVLTEARLEQGARAVIRGGGELTFDMKLMGPFIAWVTGDVQKECEAELEASSLTWKAVSREVVDAAKKWYVSKIEGK